LECVGQLALLIFHEVYLEYHQLHDFPPPFSSESKPWIRIATDNQGLITRIKAGLATMTVFAGAGLCPEYDIVNKILACTRHLPIPLAWEHVKVTMMLERNGAS
jgi:hypothetical protein